MIEFFHKLNWVDILVIALAVRIIYISIKTGFLTELIKTFGMIVALFATFHWYTKLSTFIGRSVHLPTPVLNIIVFAGIWLLLVLVFKFLRDGLFLVFTIDTISLVDKWGAIVVSTGRFFITASMIMFVLLLSDEPYLEHMVFTSLLKPYVLSVAPRTYHRLITDGVSRFFPKEKANSAVFEQFAVSDKD